MENTAINRFSSIPAHARVQNKSAAWVGFGDRLTALLIVACLLNLMPACTTVLAQKDKHEPPQPNRADLSLPIADRKLVIAHYMTGMIPAPDTETEHWMALKWYDPNGPTAPLGGIYQTLPDVMLVHPDLMPMKQAALFEMRTAKTLGVDGFNFFYPMGPDEAFRDRYDRIILSFFQAAKEHDLDFKLTLCFSPFGGDDLSANEKARILGKHLGKLLEQTGDSRHWLRTPDGRLLIYTWLTASIVNKSLDGKQWELPKHPELLPMAAEAFDVLADTAGTKIAVLFQLDHPQDAEFVERVLDYFPAVYGWCRLGDDLKNWRRVAAQCKQRSRTYIQEVHGDFYTSKVYPLNSWSMIFDPMRAVQIGVDGIERHVHVMGLSRTFRDKLQMAIDLDSPLINLTTWNDYPEGHHLAPEINHNFGFAILLKHYLERWRSSDEHLPDDTVVVFFKKYPAGVTPEPYHIRPRVMSGIGEPSADDGIEVVTLLSKPGVLQVNRFAPREVPAGMTVSRFPMQPGPVSACVERDGRVAAELTTPEWITLAPFRTDRLTYSFSSAFDHYYELIFGKDAPKHTSMQYVEDEHGTPTWRHGVQTEYTPDP